MKRLALFVSGLALLGLGTLFTATPVAAEDPITLSVKAEQRVEQLPHGPLCWNVFSVNLPPGSRVPPTGYVAEPMSLGYQTGGVHRLDYAGGPSLTTNVGDALFVGQDNWHAHSSIGTTPLTVTIFSLTCQQIPSGIPGITQIGNTGTLSGTNAGPDMPHMAMPHTVRLILGTGNPGSQYPTHTHAGPESVYVWEGELAVTTSAGVIRLKAGEVGVIPPGTAHQPTIVGNAPAKFLVAALTPQGEPHLRVLSDVAFPTPAASPAALPRAGDSFDWVGTSAMLAGLLLLVTGFSLHRKKA